MTSESKVGIVVEAVDRATTTLKKTGAEFDSLSQKIQKNQDGLQALAIGSTVAFSAMSVGLAKVVRSGAELEQTRISFDTMLGSAEKGKKLMEELSQFGLKTPFEIGQLRQSTKQLLAYGVEADKVIDTLKVLGDISAGVGMDKLPQLMLAFGQVKANTKLAGSELRQFAEAGVPLLDGLSKQFGKTASEIRDMISAGEVTFEDVEKALRAMTEEGGTFFNLMDRQSKSLIGVWSNLMDTIAKASEEIGMQLVPVLIPVVEKLIVIVEQIAEWAKSNPKLTAVILVGTTALAGLVAILTAIGLIIPSVMAALGLLGITMAGVLSATGVGLVVAGIVLIANNLKGIVEVLFDVEITWKEIWNSIIEFTSDVIADIIVKIEPLIDILKKVKSGVGDFVSNVKGGAVELAGDVLKAVHVDDAIITPKGDIVKPADDDYIIATKDPKSIGGGAIFNFDFRGANVMDKNVFIRDITGAISKGVNLEMRGM